MKKKFRPPLQVAVLRSTNLKYDSRLLRLTKVLDELKISWLAFGIDRNLENLPSCSDSEKHNLMSSRTSHGRGIRNFLSYIYWNLWITKKLFSLNVKILYICDVDAALAVFLYKLRNPKVCLVLDLFDPIASRPLNRIFSKAFDVIEGFMIRSCDHLILPSSDRVRSKTLGNRFTLVNNWPTEAIDLTVFSGFTSKQASPNLFYAGLLSNERGLDLVLKAVLKAHDWHMTIAGYGPLEEKVRRLASSHPSKITFLGRIPHEQVLTATSTATVILAAYSPKLVNSDQLASNKYYEAILCQVPILSNLESAVGRAVSRLGIGWTFQFYDLKSIETALLQIKSESRDCLTQMKKNLKILRDQEELHSASSVLPKLLAEMIGRE